MPTTRSSSKIKVDGIYYTWAEYAQIYLWDVRDEKGAKINKFQK